MQSRTSKAIILLFATVTLLAVVYAVHLSLDPNNYFFYRPEDRAKWVYHPGSVAFVGALMLAEAGVACVALVARRPRALWLRCLLGLTLLVPWAVFCTMLIIHMPAYTLFHHLWVWLLVIALVTVTLGSAIKQVYTRFRRKGPPNSSFKSHPLRGSA